MTKHLDLGSGLGTCRLRHHQGYNPFSSAAPLGGQTTQIASNLSPKRDGVTKRLNITKSTDDAQQYMIENTRKVRTNNSSEQLCSNTHTRTKIKIKINKLKRRRVRTRQGQYKTKQRAMVMTMSRRESALCHEHGHGARPATAIHSAHALTSIVSSLERTGRINVALSQ